MMVSYPRLQTDQIELLMMERYHLSIEWMKEYHIKQKDLVRLTALTKHKLEQYLFEQIYSPWSVYAVENAILDLLYVGPKRYIYYPHKNIPIQLMLKIYSIEKHKVVLPWQTPSNPSLCIHLKLY